MSDTITPASLRAHADWIDGCESTLASAVTAERLRVLAASLEAESARDEEAERYSLLLQERLIPDGRSTGGKVPDWFTPVIRDLLDILAADGRLLPEGGTVLTAEQSDDVRQYLRSHDLAVGMRLRTIFDPIEPSDCGCGKSEACDRVLCPLIDTTPAVSVPDSGRCTGAGDCEASPHVHGCFADIGDCDDPGDHPDSGPDGTPEKPWPTWQDVPEGVRYWHGDGRPNPCLAYWVNQGGVRMHGDAALHEPIPSVIDDIDKLAPFVRVDGDKA
ncbi:hypothetical protein GS462_26490 [Rhodococcus hoagii]|nr:hypothetical protein [Prescottella equi]